MPWLLAPYTPPPTLVPDEEPPPAPPGRIDPQTRPARLDAHERMRIRAAAARAVHVYPGPVGKLVQRELLDWETFGWRLGGQAPQLALVDAVMAADEPAP